MNPRMRAAAAGAAAATVWGLLEPVDQRLFRCDYSDVRLVGLGDRRLGFVVHAANGAVFGLVFHAVRRRVDIPPRRLGVALALAENTTLWPLMAFVDRELFASPRAFAQSTVRHVVFGWLLGSLA